MSGQECDLQTVLTEYREKYVVTQGFLGDYGAARVAGGTGTGALGSLQRLLLRGVVKARMVWDNFVDDAAA